jgi:hypothetical protein
MGGSTLRSIDASEFGWTSRDNAQWLATFAVPGMRGGPERRRSARVDLMGQVQGQLVSVDLPIVVLEISLGGMRIATPVAFEPGARGQFLLTLGDGAGVMVPARIVHCSAVEGASPAAFVSGVQFLDDEDGDGSGINDLVQKIR